MNILKSKFSQMVLTGLVFSLILGGFSFVVHDYVKRGDLEKQVVVIDVTNQNILFRGITGTGVDVLSNFGDKVRTVSGELSESINYSKVRYQSDPKLNGGCHLIKMEFTDNSIFLETRNYPIVNRELMNECLNNLFSFSFDRLKQKLSLNASREILRIKYLSEDIISRNEELIIYQKTEKQKPKKIRTLVDAMCEQLEDIYTIVLTDVKLISETSILSEDKSRDSKTGTEGLLSVFNLFQSVSAFNTLAKECDVVDMIIRNQELSRLTKTESHLIKAKEILAEVTFKDIFTVEKINIITKHQEGYFSKKNIVITFMILGFIVGFLLLYNFRISEKMKNE